MEGLGRGVEVVVQIRQGVVEAGQGRGQARQRSLLLAFGLALGFLLLFALLLLLALPFVFAFPLSALLLLGSEHGAHQVALPHGLDERGGPYHAHHLALCLHPLLGVDLTLSADLGELLDQHSMPLLQLLQLQFLFLVDGLKVLVFLLGEGQGWGCSTRHGFPRSLSSAPAR